MRNIKSLFVFAFGLFFGLSAFAQNTDEQGRIIVNDEASFWDVQNNLGGSYIQTADITLTSTDNQIAPDGSVFTGTYDGGGHKITVNVSRDRALFGVNNGTIKNLELNDISVHATGDIIKQVAVLCWDNKGSIENIKATGCFVSNDYADEDRGGAIITALNVGRVYNCHATNCTVYVYGNAGGIVGRMGYYPVNYMSNPDGANISYCSFQGSVTSRESGYYSTGNASGIVAEIVTGSVTGCFVENGTNVVRNGQSGSQNQNYVHDAAGIGVESAQATEGDVNVSNCYSGAILGNIINGTNYPISTDGTNSNCYTNNSGLSGEALADALNAGLEPPAFEIGTDGNIVFIDQTEFDATLITVQDGDFLSSETWGNKRFSNATATSVTIAHAVTLSGSVVIPSNIQLTVADGGSLTINDGGSFVRGNSAVNNVTIKKNLSASQWNFIGLANNGAISQLGAEGLPDMWALAFDYVNNKWYESDFLHMDDNLARGNGIFVWTDGACTVSSVSATHTDGDLTVTNGVTGSTEAGRWMALANPYMGELDVAAFVGGNTSRIQGGIVYLYNGTSFNTQEAIPTTVPVGEGFFVNMTEGNTSITFQPSQMVGYPSTGAKAVAREKEYVQVSVSTDGYKVPVMICRNDLAGQEYDIFDANKMFGDGSVAEPYFVTEGINLCKEEIKSMPYYATMNIKSGEARTVEIVADAIPEGYSATLIDGDEEIELTEGMVYTTDIASGENAERFKLLIGEKNVSLEEAEATENLIQVSNVGRRVNISARGAIEAEVYNALGQKVYTTANNSFTLEGVSAGAYIIKVSDGKSVKSEKIIVQ
ncbi:MAG TPA: T9SS type A sorting domain-containing protein [Candidatus Onthomorpha intestinigallinarum]|uniref:T9SS type A sorting domain-containing protein n=1 Tax=Candidatus Onthomorpha intestinigallinarum TaxID=2840880 RepID=A0A9D1UHD9_9BACT|nr:T9SS type A sorting domain-containing protein [Candidatus Onthomorpha intestinigallinarum]